MPGDHVFISYITEDSEAIDELQAALEAADFIVWRDKDKLWPGDDWRMKIRDAIRGGSFVFLACFSSNLAKREKSYQYEELTLAAEEYRLRPPGASWLMTARLDECEIPDIELGMGRTLGGTIHRVDLFGKQKFAQSSRLIVAIQRAMGSSPATPPPAVTKAASEAARAESDVVEQVRELLRHPELVMDFDEYLTGLRTPILAQLRDRERFPLELSSSARLDRDLARGWVDRVKQYDDLLAAALVPTKLITMYGAQAHEQELTRSVQSVAAESSQQSGFDFLTSLHQYPAVLLTYAAALGALAKRNYSMLRAVTADVIVSVPHTGRVPFILTSGSQSVTEHDRWRQLGTMLCREDEGASLSDEQVDQLLTGQSSMRFAPISDHLYTVLAPLFAQQFPNDADYADAFDQVEVLLDAISEDARAQNDNYFGPHGGYGRYTYRHRHSREAPEATMLKEVEAQGAGWTPLLGGLFGGDPKRAASALAAAAELTTVIRRQQRFG